MRDAEPSVDALFEPPDDPFLAHVRDLRDALLATDGESDADLAAGESAGAGSQEIPAEVMG